MAGRYYTPPTPHPPPENTLDVFMDGDAVVIRTTITSSHYLAAQFVNKIAREHHEGGGLIVGINTEWREDHEPDIVYHLSLLLVRTNSNMASALKLKTKIGYAL
jgi:hypothetical protein